MGFKNIPGALPAQGCGGQGAEHSPGRALPWSCRAGIGSEGSAETALGSGNWCSGFSSLPESRGGTSIPVPVPCHSWSHIPGHSRAGISKFAARLCKCSKQNHEGGPEQCPAPFAARLPVLMKVSHSSTQMFLSCSPAASKGLQQTCDPWGPRAEPAEPRGQGRRGTGQERDRDRAGAAASQGSDRGWALGLGSLPAP